MRQPTNDGRWQTAFGRWVMEFGATTLAVKLRVMPSAVYMWIGGDSRPKPEYALRIVELSGGKLTLENVYAQTNEISQKKRVR